MIRVERNIMVAHSDTATNDANYLEKNNVSAIIQ